MMRGHLLAGSAASAALVVLVTSAIGCSNDATQPRCSRGECTNGADAGADHRSVADASPDVTVEAGFGDASSGGDAEPADATSSDGSPPTDASDERGDPFAAPPCKPDAAAPGQLCTNEGAQCLEPCPDRCRGCTLRFCESGRWWHGHLLPGPEQCPDAF